ncbi:hypothetical protein J6590_000707 [Homalodisca vitripennis]|nr:hypothetical protein J6590_000707 [Homalodisca vitripennis]
MQQGTQGFRVIIKSNHYGPKCDFNCSNITQIPTVHLIYSSLERIWFCYLGHITLKSPNNSPPPPPSDYHNCSPLHYTRGVTFRVDGYVNN